jgi:hypothetical protein
MIGTESRALELLVDNQSTIALSKNPVLHYQSKHIDVRYHIICECIDEGRIILSYTATEQQLVDDLTKALGRLHFQELHDRIDVMSTGDSALE